MDHFETSYALKLLLFQRDQAYREHNTNSSYCFTYYLLVSDKRYYSTGDSTQMDVQIIKFDEFM